MLTSLCFLPLLLLWQLVTTPFVHAMPMPGAGESRADAPALQAPATNVDVVMSAHCAAHSSIQHSAMHTRHMEGYTAGHITRHRDHEMTQGVGMGVEMGMTPASHSQHCCHSSFCKCLYAHTILLMPCFPVMSSRTSAPMVNLHIDTALPGTPVSGLFRPPI